MSKEELTTLINKFQKEFGVEPEVCVAVPGRVNIIGEHVDYSGFPVLPMALQRYIIVVAALSKSETTPTLKLVNTDPNHVKATRCLNNGLEIDYLKEGWSCYFVCGMRGAFECKDEAVACQGMRALVSGSVPHGAGLSSSSALVCSAFLATAVLNKIEISLEEAAVKCASCERYIGTEGGGMDQAIALLASSGCAKLVEFDPVLKASNVCLPEQAVFVVAHSQAVKNKAASSEFNTRVVECRLAAQLIAKSKGLDWRNVRKLKTVLDSLNIKLSESSSLVTEVLPKDIYTKSEICKKLEVCEEELNNESLSHNTKDILEFRLKQRALHVFEEAQRVYAWKEAAENCDLDRMGMLMNQSHSSLRDLYDCSHSEVDKLVNICISAGALGARITGAGWGGCIVALTTKDHVDKFISSVKLNFYCDKPCDDLIFPTSPGQGASIYTKPFKIN